MGRLRVLSGREVCKVLQDHGFEVVRQRGSHIALQQRRGGTTVTVLDAVHRACTLQDLRLPAGDRLEALKGDLAGRFSLRANDQYRITFQWEQKGPYADDVTCEDYH